MSYTTKGTVKDVLKTQSFGDNSMKVLVIKVKDGQYENDLALDFWNDKAKLLDNVSIGDEVEVSFDVRSREYNGKYFTNAGGYKVDVLNKSQSATSNNTEQIPEPVPEQTELEQDDLPF